MLRRQFHLTTASSCCSSSSSSSSSCLVSLTAATSLSTASPAAAALFQSHSAFTREERAPGARPASSRVNNRRRHPLERMRQKPSSRNISLPVENSDATGGSEGSGASQAERDFSLRPVQLQQAALRKSERLERDEHMLWNGAVLTDDTSSVAQHIKKLHANPKYRESQKSFLLTGQHLMEEAMKLTHQTAKATKNFSARLRPKHLLVRSDRQVPEWASRLRNTEIVAVKPQVLDALYPGNDGFVGDFQMPDPPLKEELMVNTKKFRSVLVLDNIDDPGLLGNMVRSAAAFAYDAVFLVNQCADWYHHDVLRASRGVHFQTLTPIYVLKEGNGDDVGAMLNHVVQRNDLVPLLLAPSTATDSHSSSSISNVGDSKKVLSSDDLSPIARAAFQADNSSALKEQELRLPERLQSHERKTLHELMLDSYCGWSAQDDGHDAAGRRGSTSTATRPFEPRHHMLCVSTDHRGNFEQRMQKMFTARKPITLLLDRNDDEHATDAERIAGETDVIESFPTALYQLRHTASWDFLPPAMRNASESLGQKQNQTFGTGGASDFPDSEGPQNVARERNISEEEFAQRMRAGKAESMERRINRLRDNTDEDVYRKFEHDRIMLDADDAVADMRSSPLQDPAERDMWRSAKRKLFEERRAASPVPEEILERQEVMNRDVLNELEQWATGYEAPPNYTHRSKTPQWAPDKWPEEERQKADQRRAHREQRREQRKQQQETSADEQHGQ